MFSTDQVTPTAEALTEDVEALLEPAEPEGVFRDSSECLALLVLEGGLLLSPPTPRPKKR
jgi:hypothetical protein